MPDYPPYQVVALEHDSRLLRGNPLGDPARRLVHVLTPPGVPADTPLPEVWMLAGYAASGPSFLAFAGFEETLPQRLGRLTASGAMGPMRVVLPDCFTRYGGSQYLDSPAVGPYRSYVLEELLPWVRQRYPAVAVGVCGKSSGGFGALVWAMREPGRFQAVACHSGDMGFEWCYLPDWPRCLNVLRQAGSVAAFLDRFWQAERRPPEWFTAIACLAMAACYSPWADGNGFDLPVDPETAELVAPVWQRWLAHDPIRLVEEPASQSALRRLRLLYLDAGEADEYHLQWGGRRLARRLQQLGIAHRFETFPGGHRHTAYRYDRSLPLLYRALTAAP